MLICGRSKSSNVGQGSITVYPDEKLFPLVGDSFSLVGETLNKILEPID